MRISRKLAAGLAVLTLACGRGQQPAGDMSSNSNGGAETAAAGQPAPVELGAAAQLDSGNAAYRTRDYKGALEHYRQATVRAPRMAAAWFGVYMARNALGDKVGADSAMRMVQSIAPGTMGAHPEVPPGGGLPAGHPAVGAGTSTPNPPEGSPATH